MAPLREAEAHQKTVADLTTLAIRDLVTLWGSLDTADATATAVALRAALPELVQSYGSVAASLAADFYDDLREQANVRSEYTTVLADPPPAEKIAVLARWAAGPLFSGTPDPELVLSRLSGGVQRSVAGVDRGTIELNTTRDPSAPRYARHASANACAFCALIASRGPVYHTETAAGGRYHDHCHCIAVPDWGDYQPAPYVARWERAYTDATRSGARGTAEVLAHMRRTLGTP